MAKKSKPTISAPDTISEHSVSQKRRTLKTLLTGAGAVAGAQTIPEQWTKPAVDAVMLPAHAVATGVCENTVEGGVTWDEPGEFEILVPEGVCEIVVIATGAGGGGGGGGGSNEGSPGVLGSDGYLGEVVQDTISVSVGDTITGIVGEGGGGGGAGDGGPVGEGGEGGAAGEGEPDGSVGEGGANGNGAGGGGGGSGGASTVQLEGGTVVTAEGGAGGDGGDGSEGSGGEGGEGGAGYTGGVQEAGAGGGGGGTPDNPGEPGQPGGSGMIELSW